MPGMRGRGRGRGPPAGRGAYGGGGPNVGPIEDYKVGSAARPTELIEVDWNNQRDELKSDEASRLPEIQATGKEPLPRRPAFGKRGRTIQVVTNHYAMRTELTDVYHYDVEISILSQRRGEGEERIHQETIAPKRLNRTIINATALQQQWIPGWAYDGRKNIHAAHPLMINPSINLEVIFSERPDREQTAAVKLRLVKINSVDTLRAWVEGNQCTDDQPQEVIQALDVGLRQSMHDDPNCHVIGGGFYYPESPGAVSPLGRGVQLWRGMQQSVRPADGGLSFNVDVAHATVYEQMPIPVLLTHVLGVPETDLGRLSPAQHLKIRRLLECRQVVLVHLGAVVKTVQSITRQPSEALTFKVPEPITVKEYFARKGRNLLHPEWPCADVGSKTSTQWIPFELLRLAPAQRATQIDSAQQAEMIRQTAQRPRERRQAIESSVQEHMRARHDETAEAFGIEIQQNMMQVPARVLEAPKVEYGSGKGRNGRPFQPDRGAWDLRDKTFFRPASMPSYGLASMTLASPHVANALQEYMHGQLRELSNYGLDVPVRGSMPEIAFADGDRHPGIVVQQAYDAGCRCFGTAPRIVFVLLPDTNTEVYKAVKRATDSYLGVPSQCFVASKAGVGVDIARGKQLQYMGNLALKINSKLGGVNQIVPSSIQWDDSYIICGADVTHPAPGSEEPSVAAVVASMDPEHARFAARIRVQARRLEVIKDLKEMVKQLLGSHYKETGRIPLRIIMYRDGVSEGQFKVVKRQEVTAIQSACAELPAVREGEPYYKPDITFIVAQKRHHTRFFPDGTAADKNGNPLPGTVVDKVVVKPVEFSFYLNSHAGLQGTSSSCLYHVLLDQNDFGMDQLQRFTYDLCYQFQRATKAVSLVPPAYYADLAAERGRCMIAKVVAASHGSSQGRIQVEWSKINEALDATTFFI